MPLPPRPGLPIRKVISGGQTGVDRAALDTALSLQIPCGGWCPRGRLAEDGRIPSRYPLQESPSKDYAERTALNVRDSDATLVLTWGEPTGGTAYTIGVARGRGKPCLVIDMEQDDDPDEVAAWIQAEGIEVINIAGPRGSAHRKVYRAASAFLRKVFAH